jgi:hypothetical protein
MNAKPSFTTKDLVAHTGIERNVLRGLLNARRIAPDIAADVGRGRSRLFSYANLFEVALANRLHHFNASHADIGTILELLRAYDAPAPSDASEDWLIKAELWARTRSFDAPTQILLYWCGAGDLIEFGVGSVEVRHPAWGRDYLCIDLTKIVVDLMVATDLKWPLAEIRPLNDAVYLRILEMSLAQMKENPEHREAIESLISSIKQSDASDEAASE